MYDYVTAYADDYHIQMIDANDLIASLDASADCSDMDQFDGVLAGKYDECSELFALDTYLMGIERPICVMIEPDGTWYMGDGHHRLAIASRRNQDIMVLFTTDGNYIMHGICSDSDMTRLADSYDVESFFGDDLELVA